MLRYLTQVSSRLPAFFLTCVLVISVTTCLSLAEDVQVIGWSDLLPNQITSIHDPLAQLTPKQQLDLSALGNFQELIESGLAKPDGGVAQKAQQIEQSLMEQGLDVDQLLAAQARSDQHLLQQSQATNPELDGEDITLPGYVLPLEQNSTEKISQFLLVPYVGACIHVPSPPANQIVYVRSETAIDNPGLFAPVWLEGQIRAAFSTQNLFLVDGSRPVDTSYTMSLKQIAAAEVEDIESLNPGKLTPDHPWWQSTQIRVSILFTQTLTNIRDRQSPGSLILGLLIAFGYGVIHTLGPGHGKAIIASYFVGEGGSLTRGISIGARIAIFHVISAVLVVGFMNFAVRQVTGSAPSDYRLIRLLSYGSIVLIGTYMLFQAIRSARRSRFSSARVGSARINSGVALLQPTLMELVQTEKSVNVRADQRVDRQAIWCNCVSCIEPGKNGGWLSLAIGAVPCTGAILVMVYGLANNLLWPSIIMVMAISLGMAVTLSTIGVLAILGRQAANDYFGENPQQHQRLTAILQIAGACCVLVIGLVLFGTTWMSNAPQTILS
ncbi:MAG: DUF3299 domain-containing protein [Microcoleaceae cyanobacterium]